jgi:hypothetical protein
MTWTQLVALIRERLSEFRKITGDNPSHLCLCPKYYEKLLGFSGSTAADGVTFDGLLIQESTDLFVLIEGVGFLRHPDAVSTPSCVCGAHKAGSPSHATWCDLK